MDSKEELVKNWLIQVQHDWIAAKKLSIDADLSSDIAICHCQECREKALKGFLILRDQTFPRMHDFRLLLQLAIALEFNFQQYQATSERLTPNA